MLVVKAYTHTCIHLFHGHHPLWENIFHARVQLFNRNFVDMHPLDYSYSFMTLSQFAAHTGHTSLLSTYVSILAITEMSSSGSA